MTRVKRGTKGVRRRKKLLELAKGFRGSRNSRISVAMHVVRRSLVYAYRDRRTKKRDFRRLWIVRINAASRAAGLRYGDFINGLNKAGVAIDRSVLADLALKDQTAFNGLVAQAKAALSK